MTPISAVIISKEKETLLILKKFAEENSMIAEVIEQADSTAAALPIIKSKKPDVLLLDMVREEEPFFEMLEQLEFSTPKLIFIAAEKSLAYQAFRHGAIDFLLKPFDFNAIMLAIYKVMKRKAMEESYQNQKSSSLSASPPHYSSQYVAVASLEKIELIKMQEIAFCKADGKYTVFSLCDGTRIMSSRNLGEYGGILDPNFFFRIHHSYIINLQHVAKISKKDGYFCELSNGEILPVAKRRQEDFNKFIKLKD